MDTWGIPGPMFLLGYLFVAVGAVLLTVLVRRARDGRPDADPDARADARVARQPQKPPQRRAFRVRARERVGPFGRHGLLPLARVGTGPAMPQAGEPSGLRASAGRIVPL